MSNLIARQFHEQWKTTASWITGHLDSFTDDELALEIAPGKNHGVWILGHLIESEDDLSKYIGKGEMIFPHYEEIFGQGIVATPGDFGATGEPPTHPELLDWLAVEFRESGWNVKALHRQIVTSAAYRQSSKMTAAVPLSSGSSSSMRVKTPSVTTSMRVALLTLLSSRTR